jgi:phage shock protein PspC (stress-responsive transcriptional regulator)
MHAEKIDRKENKKVKKIKVKRKSSKPSDEQTDRGQAVHEHYYYTPSYYPQRVLYRSTRNNWLGGVCGGIAEYFKQDPKLIRLLWVVVTIFSIGLGIIAYILFWIFVKKNPYYYHYPDGPMAYNTGQSQSDVIHVHYHYRKPETG